MGVCVLSTTALERVRPISVSRGDWGLVKFHFLVKKF